MDALILIVEDDPSLREVTRLALSAEGYRVVEAADGPTALELFSAHRPNIVLLDLMLPGLDGFEVCRRIRRTSLVPIIMVTARQSTVDVVVGLESGADDYITKPYEFPELVARIRSVLRRVGHHPTGSGPSSAAAGALDAASEVPRHAETLRLGGLLIDPEGFAVTRVDAHGEEIEISLTATEFRLLLELAGHRGQVLTRDQLLERVWGYTYLGDSRLVDVHIQRLRAKIEDDQAHPTLIQTVRGVGYRGAR